MKTVLIVLLAALTATPVLADPPHRDRCERGERCKSHPHDRHHKHHRDSRHDNHHNRGRDLTPAELRFLPPLPPHQRYRVVDDRVVRMDENTMAIVAVLGLLTTLMAAR